jgi:hypothetical protein
VTIIGGGIDVVRASSFPAVHPTLTVVAQLVSESRDRDKRNQVLVLEGTTPQDSQWFHAESPPFSWRRPDKAGRPAKHNFIARLPMLILPMEGEYTIRLLLGSDVLASFPLWADRVVPSEGKGKTAKKGEGQL